MSINMPSLDDFKIDFKFNHLDIDDPAVRQALIDLPTIKNDPEALQIIDNEQSVDQEFVEKYIIPGIREKKGKEMAQFKILVQTNADLKALVDQFAFIPPASGTTPVAPSTTESVASVRDNFAKFMSDGVNTVKELLGGVDPEEKNRILDTHIVYGANRVMQKFDAYVLRGDGQYGDERDWPGFRDSDDIASPDKSQISGAVDDMSRDNMITALSSLVEQANNNELELKLGEHTLKFDSIEDKKAEILTRLTVIENAIDELDPSMLASAGGVISSGVKATIGGAIQFIWGLLGVPGTLAVGAGAVAIWKSNQLPQDSIIRNKFTNRFLRNPVTAKTPGSPSPTPTPTPTPGSPQTPPEAPKPQGALKGLLDDLPADHPLRQMKPQSDIHKLFLETLRDPAAGLTAQQRAALSKWSREFDAGKLSLEVYLKRIGQIANRRTGLFSRIADVYGHHAPGGRVRNTLKGTGNVVSQLTEKVTGGRHTSEYSRSRAANGKILTGMAGVSDFATTSETVDGKTVAMSTAERVRLFNRLGQALRNVEAAQQYRALSVEITHLEATSLASPKNKALQSQLVQLQSQRVKLPITPTAGQSADNLLADRITEYNRVITEITTGTPTIRSIDPARITGGIDINRTLLNTSMIDDILKRAAQALRR